MEQGYTLEKLPNMPAILLTFQKDFTFQRDARSIVDGLFELLDAAPEPLYDITDARLLDLNFTDLVMGLQLVTRGIFSNDRPILKHPNLKEVVFIATSKLTELAGNALQQVQYGGYRVTVFKTMDEALAYVKEKSGSTPKPA
jgi:hypothetical protein